MHLPMAIARAEMEGPTLLIGGDDWSMSATCLWRWAKGEGQVVSCEAPNVADLVWDLVGESIVDVEWRGSAVLGHDPSLQLASGGTIDILSDAPFDTWVLHVRGLTLVGPLAMSSER